MTTASAPRPVPLLTLGEARRASLKDGVTRVAAEWHRAWASEGVAAPIVEVSQSCGLRPRAVGREWVTVAAFLDEELLLHGQASPDFARTLCTAGLRDGAWTSFASARGGLESSLTEDALRALCEQLIRAALPAAACPVAACGPAALEQAGAAWQKRAVSLTIGAGRADASPAIELRAAPRLADILAGPRPRVAKPESLAARRRATDAERIALTVTLGTASVAWRDLSALAIGDAIVLDQELGTRCTLSVGASQAVAEAHLGRADRSLAVQITRVLAAPAARAPSREN